MAARRAKPVRRGRLGTATPAEHRDSSSPRALVDRRPVDALHVLQQCPAVIGERLGLTPPGDGVRLVRDGSSGIGASTSADSRPGCESADIKPTGAAQCPHPRRLRHDVIVAGSESARGRGVSKGHERADPTRDRTPKARWGEGRDPVVRASRWRATGRARRFTAISRRRVWGWGPRGDSWAPAHSGGGAHNLRYVSFRRRTAPALIGARIAC